MSYDVDLSTLRSPTLTPQSCYWDTFTRILSDPARYGFNPADRTTLGGSIWFDFMHPTSRVYNILAGEIAQFLASQPPPSPSLQHYLFSFLAFLTRHKSKGEKSTYKTAT
jgi:hypothetical protein